MPLSQSYYWLQNRVGSSTWDATRKAGQMKKPDFPDARSFALAPDAKPGSPSALSPYIDNGVEIFSPQRYFDPEFAHNEWQAMWRKTWSLAGLLADIPNVGDYFKYDLGPESFIIVRTGTGAHDVKAYYNVCQHRGNRLVMDDFGSAERFVCIFHLWAWNIDGSLHNIQDRETFREELVKDNPPLTEVRCEVWEGLVFINMDLDAKPLIEFLDVLPEHLAPFNIGQMKVIKDLQTEWPCNWKIAHDAFIEVYHVQSVHPEILPFLNDYEVQWDLYGNGMSRMLLKFGEVSPHFPDQDTVNAGLQALLDEVDLDPTAYAGTPNGVRRALQDAKRIKAARLGLDYSAFTDDQLTDDWNYSIFPNVTFNAHPEGLLIQRFRPHPRDPQKSIYDLMVLIHPVDDPKYRVPAYMGVEEGTDISGNVRPERRHIAYGDPGLGPVISQDSVMMGHMQGGVQSFGYGGARYSEQEQQLRHWHLELERYLSGEK